MRDETLQSNAASPLPIQTDGILVFYKPQEMTSHGAVNFVRGLTGVRRVGHTGTLDPMAEGVLPVCIGKATRVIEFMDGDSQGEAGFGTGLRNPHSKAYECEMRLGVTTDTLDIWGNIVSSEDPAYASYGITPERIRETFESFTGDIGQIPPAYSAIKYKGKKLYEYARAGRDIPEDAMRPRMIRIDSIEVTDIVFGADDSGGSEAEPHERGFADSGSSGISDMGFATVRFSVVCSKGTYVRSIVRDVGDALGCGAVMSALTRTKSGVFTLADAHTMDEVIRAADENALRDITLAADSAISFMPAVDMDASGCGRFVNGMPVRMPDDTVRAGASRVDAPVQTGGYVRVYSDGRFLGIGISTDGIIKPRKVILT
jgi:tRNA pseudouridine55 synthase